MIADLIFWAGPVGHIVPVWGRTKRTNDIQCNSSQEVHIRYFLPILFPQG